MKSKPKTEYRKFPIVIPNTVRSITLDIVLEMIEHSADMSDIPFDIHWTAFMNFKMLFN
jgi:hypothetical protein